MDFQQGSGKARCAVSRSTGASGEGRSRRGGGEGPGGGRCPLPAGPFLLPTLARGSGRCIPSSPTLAPPLTPQCAPIPCGGPGSASALWRIAMTSRETQEGHGAHGLPSHPQPAAAHPHSRGPALGAAGLATEEKVRRSRTPGRRVCLSCRAAAAMIKDGRPERTRTAGRGRDRKCVTWETEVHWAAGWRSCSSWLAGVE